MEKNRICKICNRRFANGKAMGGHMRSHLAKLPLPPKPISQQQQEVNHPSPIVKSPTPSSSSSLNYPFSKNPMQSYRSINHELPLMASKPNLSTAVTNDDIESEADSPRNNPTRKRSKRCRKSVEKVAVSSPEQVSSISDIFSEEDVALCLLMLSKDKRTWMKQLYMEEEEGEAEAEAENEADDDDDESFGATVGRSKVKKYKYKCATCKKGFRSYQALGGHKASHKRIKTNVKEEEDEYEERGSGSGGASTGVAAGVVERRIFKCPFCDKVFDSGQALGGHKKVHFSYLGNANMPVKSSNNLLDLNLPAPEDDSEVTQAEFSTISNTRFYRFRN